MPSICWRGRGKRTGEAEKRRRGLSCGVEGGAYVGLFMFMKCYGYGQTFMLIIVICNGNSRLKLGVGCTCLEGKEEEENTEAEEEELVAGYKFIWPEPVNGVAFFKLTGCTSLSKAEPSRSRRRGRCLSRCRQRSVTRT